MLVGWLRRVKEWVPDVVEAYKGDSVAVSKRVVDEFARNRYVELHGLVSGSSPDADALNELGCIWLEGRVVEHNWPLARALFVAAGRLGSREAYLNLGHMYWHGKGVPVSELKAMVWYRFAANKGSMDGLCELGHAHAAFAEDCLEADGEPHLTKACDCYLAAAQEGHREAMSSLGHLLLNDSNRLRNEATGLYWLTYAAALGDPLAADRIADFFNEARMGIPDPGSLLSDFWRNYRCRRAAVAERDRLERE
ncbi:tetratricopeptide repeat protein [Stutzerimonas stutzeri]|uniref:Sel1 repeat family protein n=1 Tax=Stutzerimonas stutzeri TaxID=316 RepID=A0A5S5B3A3_STUST|nr:tetratricopeptide repeat protein [Stutzerimonas stutzeri]TYP61485.1 hypothetical protein A9A72_124221 [Stutzerimonas stutzeri]